MYCIIFHTMLYIPVLLLLNKHSFIHSSLQYCEPKPMFHYIYILQPSTYIMKRRTFY